MHSQHIISTFATLFCAVRLAAAYTIEDTFDASNFFNEFEFFTAADPTNGFVSYTSAATANTTGLAGYLDGAVFLGVDHTTVNPTGSGRASTRVSSNKTYNHGLFIADIAHMPGGICGVWPAFWLVGGPSWPNQGEIDIIEGVNDYATNQMTLHTSAGCTMSGTGAASTSKVLTSNCNSGNGYTGCGTSTSDTQSYGAGFNQNNGGVYAMEWTSDAIQIYFFPRSAIPADITSGNPTPATWGAPMASFIGGSGCNIDQHFVNQQIIFDTTFCGDWAGKVWTQSPTCAPLASTCNAYVSANPSAFDTAYWQINSVKVYQNSTTPAKSRSLGIATLFTA